MNLKIQMCLLYKLFLTIIALAKYRRKKQIDLIFLKAFLKSGVFGCTCDHKSQPGSFEKSSV